MREKLVQGYNSGDSCSFILGKRWSYLRLGEWKWRERNEFDKYSGCVECIHHEIDIKNH